MRKSILAMFVVMIALFAVACGGNKPAGNGGDANAANGAGGGGGGGGEADAFAGYKKQGRLWLVKSTTKMDGMDPMVTYTKTEITKVEADHAIMTMWTLDKDKKPMAGMEKGNETKIEFKKAEPVKCAPAPKEPKKQKVKVEAGEFDCVSYDDGKMWMMEKYPMVMVKGDMGQTQMELVEFKE